MPHILASNVPGPPVAISAMAPAGPPWDFKRGRTINGKNEYDILVEGSAAEGCRQAGISSVVIAAPDCSTSSRARDIKIPGVRCRQLRSTEFPEGFNTEFNEKEYGRIKDANDIAAWTAQVCAMALEDGRGLMVENPFRSSVGLAAFKRLAADPTVRLVRCDSCMQGSLQFKPTGFLTNLPDAERLLGLQCQGGRSGPCTRTGVYHEGWDPIWDESLVRSSGRRGGWIYPSAGEAEYPGQLAARIADCVKAFLDAYTFTGCKYSFSEFFCGANAPTTAEVQARLQEHAVSTLDVHPSDARAAAGVAERSGVCRPSDAPDHNKDRSIEAARGLQWLERDVWALENDTCVGGLRNPMRAKIQNIRLAFTGRISRVILVEFLDKHPEFFDLVDGGSVAAELVRRPLDDLRSQLVGAWAYYAAKEEKSPRV